MSDLLDISRDAHHVVTLTMNDPAQYNTLSEDMLGAFEGAVADLAADTEVRAVIIAAAGKAFCAGHNLKEMRSTPERAYYDALFARCSRFMLSLVGLPVPVIAKVQGLATAAGCQLVATCDLAIASTDAKFGVSGVNLGLFCSTPSVALSRNIGRKRAMEMLMTGAFIPAETAADWGLVNRAVPPESLGNAVEALAHNIASKSPVPIRAGKALFYRQLEASLGPAYADASDTMAANMMSHDAGEGVDAFIEKRDPVWRGD